jgi:hypothetical protein
MNIQDEVQKIHARYGTTEKANYEIQKVCETYARIQIEKDREKLKYSLITYSVGRFTIECVFEYNPINLD